MNFFSADVAIKVDDSKLPVQLAKVKSATLRTVDKIKAAFGRMATSFKAAWTKMVRVAKYAAVGIAAALTLATRAAMKQEDAQFLLMAALKISGEYTARLEKRFLAFAASIQQVTIYGDEEVLALMQLQKSLGVTADKLELAAKQAIGLAAATGRDVRSMAMYIALAQQGEFTMLRRYIPALRATTDKSEQLAIITRVCAEGFKLAEERAKTTSGALRQMWNVIGDVAEVICAALLPGIKDSARAIKKWAEGNKEEIGRWAKAVVAWITYVHDMLWIFAVYMQGDWRAGVKVGLDTAIELFKGFGESIYVIIDNVAQRLATTIGARIKGAVTDAIDWQIAYQLKWQELTYWRSPWKGEAKKGEAAKYANEIVAGIREARIADALGKEIEPLGPQLARIAADTAKAIRDIIPAELEDALGKVKVEAIYEEPAWVKEKALYGEAMRAEAQAMETVARTLYKSDDAMMAHRKDMVAESGALWEMEAAKRVQEWETANAVVLRGMEQEEEKRKNILERTAERMYEFTRTFQSVIASGLEQSMRDWDNWKDHVKGIFKDLYYSAVRMAVLEPLAGMMAGGITGAMGAVFGEGIFGVPARPAGITPVESFQHGGTVEKTGLAVVHKGETFSGVGGSNIDVRIHNEGQPAEISAVESYMISDQRIIDVTMKAAEDDGPYRRSISQLR